MGTKIKSTYPLKYPVRNIVRLVIVYFGKAPEPHYHPLYFR